MNLDDNFNIFNSNNKYNNFTRDDQIQLYNFLWHLINHIALESLAITCFVEVASSLVKNSIYSKKQSLFPLKILYEHP